MTLSGGPGRPIWEPMLVSELHPGGRGRSPSPRGAQVLGRALAVVTFASMLAACGRGVATPVKVGTDAGPLRPGTTAVYRVVPAPVAHGARPVDDPRCRAARRLFVRPASAAEPPHFTVSEAGEQDLAQVEPLINGEIRGDFDAVADLSRRLRSSPGSITAEDSASAVVHLNRLLAWTATTCPSPTPVWGCANPVFYGATDPWVAAAISAGEDAPDDAITDRIGDVEGRRVELSRGPAEVVYGWLDLYGLNRRRVDVQRVGEVWAVTSVAVCDDQKALPDPLDGNAPIIEELPDQGDGPEYAPTTTTAPVVTTTVPQSPCGYDPNNTTDAYATFGDYMANGPAEPGCYDRLTPAGKACLADPPSGDVAACFDM